jgi:superfamily II DNA or RNA helicase
LKSSLWDHQQRAIEELRISLLPVAKGGRGKRRPIVQSPTGSGKTVLAAQIIERALAKGNRVAFTVPAISLIDKTVQDFYEEGLRDVGVIQADHRGTNYGKKVQVCSVDTIARRDFPATNIVIVDECHVAKAAITEWMEEDPNKIFIGLSATPWRRGLGTIYDDLIIAATIEDLIAKGILAPFKVFAPSRPDLGSCKVARGDYVLDELGKIAKKDKALIGDVIETWLAKAEGRPTICFCVDRAHARLLQERFKDAGVSAAYVDHEMSLLERAQVERDFHSGAVKVVCNVDCLGVGIDWDIRCLILARPTRSIIRYVQNVGRGLRRADGKDHLLILDHSDTTQRLGMVSDIKRDKLSEGKLAKSENEAEEQETPLPVACKQCSYMKPPGTFECPSCGHIPERKTRAVMVKGELVELTDEELKAMREREQKAKKPEATEEEKLIFLRMLHGYAKAHGKSDGWVAHSYREKFKVWPNGFGRPAPLTPSIEVLGWIKHRNIAYAMAMKRSGNPHRRATWR